MTVLGGADRARLGPGRRGRPVSELVCKYGMSNAKFYAWKKQYGALSASEIRFAWHEASAV